MKVEGLLHDERKKGMYFYFNFEGLKRPQHTTRVVNMICQVEENHISY